MGSTQHFGEDAADGPHVSGRTVGVRGQQQLGRSVPARGNRVRVAAHTLSHAVTQPRQPHVRHLQHTLPGQ